MTATPQKNGPASPASDPSRGSHHPCRGMKNMETYTTPSNVAAMIKLPYANASPANDLADALAMLRVVMELMGDGRGMNAAFASDIFVVIAAAKERIEPVFGLLDTLDLIEQYRASRTTALLRKEG